MYGLIDYNLIRPTSVLIVGAMTGYTVFVPVVIRTTDLVFSCCDARYTSGGTISTCKVQATGSTYTYWQMRSNGNGYADASATVLENNALMRLYY